TRRACLSCRRQLPLMPGLFPGFIRGPLPLSTPTCISRLTICPETPEWSKDGRPRFYRRQRRAGGEPTALAGSPKIPLPGGHRPPTDVPVNVNHVLPSQADTSPRKRRCIVEG